MRRSFTDPTIVSALALLAASAHAETATWTQPDLDSRTYPFLGQTSDAAEPTFGQYADAMFVGAFDNRDSQIQLAFDTTTKAIPTGLDPEDYDVESVTLTITLATPNGTPLYDPTYDAVATYPFIGNTSPAADDPGRPISIFGAGFRNGYTAFEFGPLPSPGAPLFGESGEGYAFSPFGQNTRHVFPIDFDAGGNARDVSTNIDETNAGANAFEANPFAVGTTTLSPGDPLTAGTVVTFDIALADPFILAYVREGLAAGQIGFVLATLHAAAGSEGGGAGGNFPEFILTENGSNAPTLEIVYSIAPAGCIADLDADNDTDVFDFNIFAPAFGTSLGDPGFIEAADLNDDNTIDVFDFNIFAPDFGCDAN